MVKRVTLDAMIVREDFALAEGEEFVLDLFQGLPITNLQRDSPIVKLLRKPDFQRETNHWTPEQVCTFLESFLDNEVIPSLILWKSPQYIFVIDGGHRLSALRAWMEDDYGDRSVSREFYNGELSAEQKDNAKRTRQLVEERIGGFSTLRDLVGSKTATDIQKRRSNLLFTRTIAVQWIQGSAAAAETSFFKINSQGTPLDDIEEMLIRNRRKPIAISARAILRAGTGHKYWSSFSEPNAKKVEGLASKFFEVLFEPQIKEPLKTIDIPVGGTTSAADALDLLMEFLVIAGSRDAKPKTIDEYPDDETGEHTIKTLTRALQIVERITGNSPGSLGLHPAVYFYTERARYSRFLFLGMALLIADKVRANDQKFFQEFTKARAKTEAWLIENKPLIGVILKNLGRASRIVKMRDMIAYLTKAGIAEREVKVEVLVAHLGLRGRIVEFIGSAQVTPQISNETKASILLSQSLKNALVCPLCGGKLHPSKSVTYDHIVRVREGGGGGAHNVQMVHPYCNSAVKN